MDIGIYCVYPAVVLFGAPKTVQAFGHLLSTGVDGAGSLILGYGGMDAVLLHAKSADSLLPMEIQGEKATLRVDRVNLPDRLEMQTRDGRVEQIPVARELPFMSYEIREFVRLLKPAARVAGQFPRGVPGDPAGARCGAPSDGRDISRGQAGLILFYVTGGLFGMRLEQMKLPETGELPETDELSQDR